jgi:hypothetical protein
MAAVVATDEWPRRSPTAAMSTPLSSRRDAWLWRTTRSDALFREKQLVEIAQAEHRQGIGNLLFDAVVLPHERRGGIGGHSRGYLTMRMVRDA